MEKDEWKFDFNGFAAGYLYNDSSRSLTEIQGSAPIARPGTPDGDNGRTQFSSRGSRFGFGALALKVNNWKTKGFIEVDFLGYDPTPGNVAGNSEASFFTNPTLRLRHAYLDAQKNGWQILIGQYWSLLGRDTDYALQTAGQPPVTGVIFQRTPQFRVVKTTALDETTHLETGAALTRPPQRDAEIPAFDWAARLSFKNRSRCLQRIPGVLWEPVSRLHAAVPDGARVPLHGDKLRGSNQREQQPDFVPGHVSFLSRRMT